MSVFAFALQWSYVNVQHPPRSPEKYTYPEEDVVLMLDDGSCPALLEPTEKNIVSAALHAMHTTTHY